MLLLCVKFCLFSSFYLACLPTVVRSMVAAATVAAAAGTVCAVANERQCFLQAVISMRPTTPAHNSSCCYAVRGEQHLLLRLQLLRLLLLL